jgi:hypothetical protein
VISDALARELWPGSSALGRTVEQTSLKATYEIVGVFRGVRANVFSDGETPLIVRLAPLGPLYLSAALRFNGPAPGAVAAIRAAALRQFPDPGRLELRTGHDIIADQAAPQRMTALMASSYAVVAVVLALAGLVGFVQYVVARSRRELGIRAAIGSAPRHLQTLMLRRALVPVALGIGAGLLAAPVLLHLLDAVTTGTGRQDDMAYVVTALLMLTGAGLVGWTATRRVLRMDIVAALNAE